MNDLGRALLGIGLVIAAIGAAVLLLGKAGLPLGRLPGDLVFRGRHTTVYFPLVTCLIVSALLSFIVWLMRR